MERRQFLRLSSLVAVGGVLIPAEMFTSCRRELLFETSPFHGKVIIVGAGAAGLYAGYLLQSKGIDFTILEAASTHGGRMGKLTGFADYPIDTGAQWLHGNNNILGDLIAKNQTKITEDESETRFWFNNSVVSELPRDPFIFEEDNLPDLSFKEYAHQKDFGSEYDNIIEAIAGDQGASASLLSAYWNSKDEENWVSGDTDYKFRETFFDVIDQHFALPIMDTIVFNTPVSEIDYSGDKIVVKSGNSQWEADKVIVTVPVSILKLHEIQFIPSLPSEKNDAFAKFGMGPGMKVFLKFSQKFFDGNLIGGAVCGAYVDDTLGKETNDHVLLAFVMGDQAQTLHNLGSDNAITNALIQELDTIYNGAASASFIASSVFDYTTKPFIKGAYGYSTIGMGDARKVAALPVDNKLFFAGEAMNTNGHHQTVHGAVESGYKAVIDLLKSEEK